ncbi:MAG: GDSL family lipase [Candidatus Hydrogenedentes bacterium]|nr:GDSL family lipase [Candidatus Hydrogenedentota bacterium]
MHYLRNVSIVALVFLAGACATLKPAAPPKTAEKPDTCVPVPREEGWMKRHNSFNERVKQGNVDLIFIGDSITQGWEGKGKATWDKYYGKRNAVNLGIGGDRTQHVLWRLENGNIDGISPKLAVLMIGTNNVSRNKPVEIVQGITEIVDLLRAKLPKTKILVLGVFPRGETPGYLRDQVAQINVRIARLAELPRVEYLNINSVLTQPDNTLSKDIMPDFVHLSEKGYELWAQAIEKKVSKALHDKPIK